MDTSLVVTGLLVLLCSLASLDLWRQYAIRDDNHWYTQYTLSVRSGEKFWTLGYRLEDLELKMDAQRDIFERIRPAVDALRSLEPKVSTETLRKMPNDIEQIRHSRVQLHNIYHRSLNSSVSLIHCGDEGPVLRIGVNDFRTDNRDVCQIFTGTSTDEPGPNSMFEIIPHVDGSFALKSIASGYFVRTVPPPQDNKLAPWKLVIGGPVVGAAEKFRHTEEGYLYSALMGGFFQCASGDMVKGYGGRYTSPQKFKLSLVDESLLHSSRELVDLSSKILAIQTQYAERHKASSQVQKAAVNMVIGMDNPRPVKICIAVPMTSKGTDMASVDDSPFWANLFDSFMKSIDWRSNRYTFRFYLGFDKGDALYDTGDSWNEMRGAFQRRASFRMSEQLMDKDEIAEVLDKKLTLKLAHFEHLEGAPTQIVSQLVLAAYVDNFDYFYQVNDDTIIVSPNWPPKLVAALAANPTIPNFGVTGPTDTNNEKIFTHAFVHRTHVEVFGHLFPPSFKNWWSDDWISTVYGSAHTFLALDVQIKHNVGAQKLHGTTRYEVDQGARLRLEDELRKGHVQIDEWLKKNSLPRLPLPNVCGYVPLAKYLTRALMAVDKDGEVKRTSV